MVPVGIDLNVEPPEVDERVDWSSIDEWEGPAYELQYDMVWEEEHTADGAEEEQVAAQGEDTDGDAEEEQVAAQGEDLGAGAQEQVPAHQFNLNIVPDDVSANAFADGIADGVPANGSADGVADGVTVNGVGGSVGSSGKKRRFYPDNVKFAIYAELLARTTPPVLHHGVTRAVAAKFGIPRRTVQKIWQKGQAGGIEGIRNKLVKKVGRKRIEVSPEAIKAVALQDRTTLQDLADKLGMKRSTLYKRFKEGCFRRHTNDIKFSLTDENKKSRVQYCLSMLKDSTEGPPKFDPMYNVVYIDEKWFYRTKRNQKYYMAHDEQRPRRAVKSKNFIEKVMFLAVITRPRFDSEGNCTFDGKLGVFPFTYVEPAKRKSKNRPRGTLETKAMTSVKKETIRDFLLTKVLPAIKAKWPAEEKGMPIFIQQDNAKTHIDVNDPEFVAAAQSDGWDIRLTCQPPNSPDLNVLDLGFFAAIQSMFHKGTPNNIDEIVKRVEDAYLDYPVDRSNRIFLTQQGCMMEVMKQNGGQYYDIPHMRKKTLEMQGALPVTLECDMDLYNGAIAFVST